MQRLQNLSNNLTSSQAPATLTFSPTNRSIAIITMYNQKNYNALNAAMRQSLISCFRSAQQDPQVKVVCFRSGHAKTFCAGANIKELAGTNHEHWINYDMFEELDLVMRTFKKPIVCAVNRLALGGGFELALHSDIILADEKAQFGLPEIKLGVFPGIGGTLISKTIGK